MGVNTLCILIGKHSADELASIIRTDGVGVVEVIEGRGEGYQRLLIGMDSGSRRMLHVFDGEFVKSDHADVYSGDRTVLHLGCDDEAVGIMSHLAGYFSGFLNRCDAYDDWVFIEGTRDQEVHPDVRLAVEIAALSSAQEAEVLRNFLGDTEKRAKLEAALVRHREATENSPPTP